MNGESDGKPTNQERVVSLFKFIEELNKLKQKVVLHVSDHPWWRSIASFHDDPENIKTYYRDCVEEVETEHASNVLLSVHKPEFQRCPESESVFEEWLEQGWDNYHHEAETKEFILRPLDQMGFSAQALEEHLQRIDEKIKLIKNSLMTMQNG